MTDRSGQQLGSYRLLRRLGSGAFAEVYLGEHRFLKSQAAIKILHTQILQEAIDKFLQEAQILAPLRNPNIVQVYDFNQDSSDGTHFLVMDYAPHGCIRELHPKGSILPLPTVVTYVQQIAAALQQAHDEKIVHRDIKPENLLLGRNKKIILSDFGIAAVAQSTASWKTQGIAGTPYYMAPEQFRGKPQPSSDQYALAVVVYEWLCGTPPFTEGDFIQLGFQHAFEPVPPLHNKVKTLAPEVEQVVMKALAKDPQQRFGSVREFANALKEAYNKQRAKQQVPMIRKKTGEQQVARRVGPSPEAQRRATEWLQSVKEEVAFKALEKTYKAVQQGIVTRPDAIRDLADKFDALARDPQKSKAFPYDEARAARALYKLAQELEATSNLDSQESFYDDTIAIMRRPADENINY